jgi:blocked-early-in-transport protein 1
MQLTTQTDDFGSTSNILSGTWKRMTAMAKRQGNHWCWFMAFLIFVLWIFILVWWLRR